MTKYYLHKAFCSLSLLVCFIWSSAQQNTDIPVNISGTAKLKVAGTNQLIKTQGSNEYQNISCGLQDKAGNLWFGSSGEGVYRFDGKGFIQFTKANGLPNNDVSSILEDKSGYIWFGTRDGICRYDGKKIIPFFITRGFMNPTNSSSDFYTEQSTKEKVWSMLQDKSGTIWFGTGDGVYCYNGKSITSFINNPGITNQGNLKLQMITSILEDKNGNIWFASGMPPGQEGICRYDGKTLLGFKPKHEGWFRKIIEDKNGNLVLATRIHGLLSCDLSSSNLSESSFSNFPQPKELLNNSLTNILKDHIGNIWIASDYGKNVGDTLGGVWCYKQSLEGSKHEFIKITNQEVSFILEDKDNNIWFGTRGTGLFRYDGKDLLSFTK